jgi:CRISPR-associated protein Csb2
MGWPDLTLGPSQYSDLAELISSINYLGRSESWVRASLQTGSQHGCPRWNCEPLSDTAEGGEADLSVACAVATAAFNRDAKRVKLVESMDDKQDAHSDSPWLRALAFSTRETLKGRLSDPPALVFLRYHTLPEVPTQLAANGAPDAPTQVNALLYALESKVLPQVTAAIEISERVRAKLMGIHSRVRGDKALVSPRFSGKDSEGKPLQGHQHSYIFPLDRDQDGRLDHLLILCRNHFTETELIAFDHLTSLWQANGLPDILCVPLQFGSQGEMLASSAQFESATPFIPTHHHRKGRGPFAEWLKGEITRECAHAGLQPPTEVAPLESLVKPGGHRYFWQEFRRNRRQEPSQRGYGFRLTFSEPVRGPFALGYGSHFGLGLFVPTRP